MPIRTILCPVDFSDVSARELDVAVEVARAFGARLVLHHNRGAVAPGLARQWDWDAEHHDEAYTDADAQRRMQGMLASLPSEVHAEGVVSVGPLGPLVLTLAEELPADLVVLGSHGWSTESHASVTDRLLAHAPCPVLAFDERAQAPARFRLGRSGAPPGEPPCIVVPTDLSESGDHAVEYGLGLAQALGARVRLLHVLGRSSEDAAFAAETRLSHAVPAELRERVAIDVREGDARAEILAHLAELRPTFAVLGEHARGLARRWLTRDTTRAVVHEATCPIWVVPRGAAV
jgi:universal stress protein A